MKKSVPIMLGIFMLIAAFSCKKETVAPPEPKGIISLVNNSQNPYDVYVNGALVVNDMPGNSWKDITKPTGTYSVRVVQVSGYLVYPTDLTFDGSLGENKKLLIFFPD